MATAISDQRRRKEAMEDLVLELSRGDEENIIHALRTAIDVRITLLLLFYLLTMYLLTN